MPNPGPSTRPTSLEHPAHSAIWQETIEPDDSVVFRRPTRGLYVATGGSLAVVDPFDHQVTYQPSDGTQLPIAVKQVVIGLGAGVGIGLLHGRSRPTAPPISPNLRTTSDGSTRRAAGGAAREVVTP